MNEGLPSDKIRDFLVTRDGDYWLATNAGLVKFTPDGTIYNRIVMIDEVSALSEQPVFTTYSPPNSKNKIISRLLEDRRGTIWVGANNGLFRLEKSDGKFNFVQVELGLPAVVGKSYVNSLYEDRSGAIWIGTENSLFRILTDGRITNYTRDESPPMYFRAPLEDRSGNFWVSTLKEGLFQFTVDGDGAPRPLRRLTPKSDSEINYILSIVESTDGKLWLGTSSGLYEFDQATARFYQYTRRSGIGENRFQAMFEDKRGNLWLVTRAGGVTRLSRRGLVSFGLEDEIAFVRSVSGINDGSLLITGFLANQKIKQRGAKVELANDGKVFDHFLWRLGRFSEKGLEWLSPALPETVKYFGSGENQTNFQARSGEWWVATGQGVFRYPKVDFEQLPKTQPITVLDKKSGLAPHDVFRLYEDSRGDVWISTFDENGAGFYRWRRDTETLDNVGNIEGLPKDKDSIRSFAEDRAGNLWVGFTTRGFARISGDHARFFDAADGVPQGGGIGMLVDREGRLWVASGGEGIARIDEPTSENPRIIKIGKNDGMSTNRTFAITQDLQGLIYIATDRDINRLNPATGEIKILKISVDQPQREFRTAFCDSNGVLWFGTTSGLVKYVPLPEAAKNPPEVLLTRVEIEGKPQKVSITGATELTLQTLAPDENQVRIDFVSLAALEDEDVRYQYKFDSQSDWTAPAPERFVNFAGLASGDYKILLRAVAGNGLASEKPTLVSFKILSPVYLRWWFVLVVLSAAIFLIYAFYRYRLSRLLEFERMRTRIATDLHDDIGANQTRISLLSEVAKQKPENGNGNLLTSIAEIARESVSSMNDIVWAIAPEHDSLHDLTRRMRRHAEEVFALRDIDLKFDAPASDLKLSVGVRRDVLLIFKEAVNNAAKYSDCSRVEIDFRVEHLVLSLKVKDNGKGFEIDSGSDGQGLRSMTRRARALGGKLQIDSGKNQGTIVKLEMPSPKASRV